MKYAILIISIFYYKFTKAQVELLRFEAIRLCDSVNVLRDILRPNLHEKTIYPDSVVLKVRLNANCGLTDKKGAYTLRNDTLILLSTSNKVLIENFPNSVYDNSFSFPEGSLNTETMTLCDCYMQMVYVFSDTMTFENVMYFNKKIYPKEKKYKVKPIDYQIYKGDTINYTDTLGIPRGVWIEFDTLNRPTYIQDRIGFHFNAQEEFISYHSNDTVSDYTLMYYSKNESILIKEKFDSLGNIMSREFDNESYFSIDTTDVLRIHYRELFDNKGEVISRKIYNVENPFINQINRVYFKP